MRLNIKYLHSDDAWNNYLASLQSLILGRGVRRVLEVGGGANPAFPLDFIAHHGLEYTVLDISAGELAKAPEGYLKVQADIASPSLDLSGGYDLIFSKLLAEHVMHGETFHRNVYNLLAPGGVGFHFFPTLYAPPFVLNRLLPERLAEYLLHIMQSGRDRGGKLGKFPAYYSWCRGPFPSQVRRFESLGYRVDEYVGFFGHDGYYLKFPLLAAWHRKFSNWLVRHPSPWLTSFAFVTLSRQA